MRYVPKKLERTADISSGGGNHLVELAKLFALSAVVLIILYLAIGALTDALVGRLSTEQEASLFSHFKNSESVASDDLDATYQDKVAMAASILARFQQEGLPAYPFQLVYLEDKEPNALAMPGGTISITTGLLDSVDSEVGLAFVIAHEIGHFSHRDHLRGLGRRVGLAAAVALVFGENAAGNLIRSGITLNEQRYSRNQETAADSYAADLVLDVYPDPKHITEFLEALADDTTPDWLHMFNTHPNTEERIEALQNQISAAQDTP